MAATNVLVSSPDACEPREPPRPGKEVGAEGGPRLDVDFPQRCGSSPRGVTVPRPSDCSRPQARSKATVARVVPRRLCCLVGAGCHGFRSRGWGGLQCKRELQGASPVACAGPESQPQPPSHLPASVTLWWVAWVRLTSPWRGFVLYPVGHSFPGWDCANRISGIYSPTVPEARHLHPRR